MALLSLDANVGVESTGLVPLDPRLEQLRALLLGREIEQTRHFHEVLDDPEQLAIEVNYPQCHRRGNAARGPEQARLTIPDR
jgi:hypothetical protein